MYKKGKYLFISILLFTLSASVLFAVNGSNTDLSQKVPAEINYQGYITDSAGVPVNGVKDIRFYIYDALTGGNWMSSDTFNSVNVSNGYFNVIIGGNNSDTFKYFSVNDNLYVSYSVDFRKKYYLQIQFSAAGSGVWETLTPRQEMSSVPYAMAARKVVYTQVLTVAYDGGDECSVKKAIQKIMGQGGFSTVGPLTPAPSVNTPWVIKVQSGVFNESALEVPDYVSIVGESSKGSKLDVDGAIKLGVNSTLENLNIWEKNSSSIAVNASNVSGVRIQNCVIEGQNINSAIDFSGSVNCVAQGNHIVGYGTGIAKGINLAGSSYCYVNDNLIDLAHYALAASTSNSRGITDSGTPFIDCYITGNTIRYVTTGAAGTTASVGIFLTAGGTGSVANNVFHKGAPAKDIVNGATGALPVWGAGGPRGNFNMRSDGAAMTAF